MRLHEHAIDLLESHDFGLVQHGLNQTAQAQIAPLAQHPFAGAHDQVQRVLGEGVVTQPATVQLVQDEALHLFGRQASSTTE